MNGTTPRYQVVIVGCGNIGGSFDTDRPSDDWPLSHAGAFTRHEGFQIRACVDPDEGRRTAFAIRWGIGLQAPGIASLSPNLGPVDVVSICSPTNLHHDHVMQAIELQPKVIFCEKPLTFDVASSEVVVEACKTRAIALAVNFSRQWDPSIEAFIQELQKGRWGSIRSIVGHYNKGILNNGSHMVDLLFRLVGDLKLVTTTCSTLDFWDNDPTTAVLLTAKGGTVPVYLSPGNARDFAFFELEVVCEKGVVRMHSGGMSWESREVHPSAKFTGYRTLNRAVNISGRYMETMAGAVDELYNFLVANIPIRSSGESAVKVQTLCTHIQRAALAQCTPNYAKGEA
jgi:predicted dehydrogenase